jgi:hypothetical protein
MKEVLFTIATPLTVDEESSVGEPHAGGVHSLIKAQRCRCALKFEERDPQSLRRTNVIELLDRNDPVLDLQSLRLTVHCAVD